MSTQKGHWIHWTHGTVIEWWYPVMVTVYSMQFAKICSGWKTTETHANHLCTTAFESHSNLYRMVRDTHKGLPELSNTKATMWRGRRFPNRWLLLRRAGWSCPPGTWKCFANVHSGIPVWKAYAHSSNNANTYSPSTSNTIVLGFTQCGPGHYNVACYHEEQNTGISDSDPKCTCGQKWHKGTSLLYIKLALHQ